MILSLEKALCFFSRQLGWEAATERFIEAAEIKPQQWPSLPAEIAEGTLWGIYKTLTGATPPFEL